MDSSSGDQPSLPVSVSGLHISDPSLSELSPDAAMTPTTLGRRKLVQEASRLMDSIQSSLPQSPSSTQKRPRSGRRRSSDAGSSVSSSSSRASSRSDHSVNDVEMDTSNERTYTGTNTPSTEHADTPVESNRDGAGAKEDEESPHFEDADEIKDAQMENLELEIELSTSR
jgi:hypothetical protein